MQGILVRRLLDDLVVVPEHGLRSLARHQSRAKRAPNVFKNLDRFQAIQPRGRFLSADRIPDVKLAKIVKHLVEQIAPKDALGLFARALLLF